MRALAADPYFAQALQNPKLRQSILDVLAHRQPQLALEQLLLRDGFFADFVAKLLQTMRQ
jgi:hypothetical protein